MQLPTIYHLHLRRMTRINLLTRISALHNAHAASLEATKLHRDAPFSSSSHCQTKHPSSLLVRRAVSWHSSRQQGSGCKHGPGAQSFSLVIIGKYHHPAASARVPEASQPNVCLAANNMDFVRSQLVPTVTGRFVDGDSSHPVQYLYALRRGASLLYSTPKAQFMRSSSYLLWHTLY